MLDPALEVGELLRDFLEAGDMLQAIVFAMPLEDVRRLGSKVIAWLTVDAVSLVAAMVHAFVAPLIPQPQVNRIR